METSQEAEEWVTKIQQKVSLSSPVGVDLTPTSRCYIPCVLPLPALPVSVGPMLPSGTDITAVFCSLPVFLPSPCLCLPGRAGAPGVSEGQIIYNLFLIN